MTCSHPPPVATWLLSKLVSGDKRESIVGDVIEQYQQRGSSGWFWRETISAIVTSFAGELSRHKLLVVAVVVLSAYLPELSMYSGLSLLVHRLDRLWYPHVIHSRWSWLVVNPWAYRLQPYLWTNNLAWCAILAVLSRSVSRWRPRQHGILITVFLVSQVLLGAPHVEYYLMDWLHVPGNAMSFYALVWYSMFMFIAIPFSILIGGRIGAKPASADSLES